MEKTDLALSKILNALADKFETTVGHLYAIMIKQAYISGVEACLSIVALIITATVFIIMLIKSYKSQKKEYGWTDLTEYFEENGGVFLVSIMLSCVIVMAFIICSKTAIDCFYNPEYYALTHILNH